MAPPKSSEEAVAYLFRQCCAQVTQQQFGGSIDDLMKIHNGKLTLSDAVPLPIDANPLHSHVRDGGRFHVRWCRGLKFKGYGFAVVEKGSQIPVPTKLPQLKIELVVTEALTKWDEVVAELIQYLQAQWSSPSELQPVIKAELGYEDEMLDLRLAAIMFR